VRLDYYAPRGRDAKVKIADISVISEPTELYATAIFEFPPSFQPAASMTVKPNSSRRHEFSLALRKATAKQSALALDLYGGVLEVKSAVKDGKVYEELTVPPGMAVVTNSKSVGEKLGMREAMKFASGTGLVSLDSYEDTEENFVNPTVYYSLCNDSDETVVFKTLPTDRQEILRDEGEEGELMYGAMSTFDLTRLEDVRESFPAFPLSERDEEEWPTKFAYEVMRKCPLARYRTLTSWLKAEYDKKGRLVLTMASETPFSLRIKLSDTLRASLKWPSNSIYLKAGNVKSSASSLEDSKNHSFLSSVAGTKYITTTSHRVVKKSSFFDYADLEIAASITESGRLASRQTILLTPNQPSLQIQLRQSNYNVIPFDACYRIELTLSSSSI